MIDGQTAKIDRAFRGEAIWGDDLAGDELEAWYADEANAYYDLYGALPAHRYEYHALNSAYGFSYLPERRFARALGVGSGFGDEFEPISSRIDQIDIVESADAYLSTDAPSESDHPNIQRHRARPQEQFPFRADTFDLALCLGVLHHVPNVTWHINELARVCRGGAYVLLREPVISMGDWRFPRPGLTPRERGIPRALLTKAVGVAGFSIVNETLYGAPPVLRMTQLIAGLNDSALTPMLKIDSWICAILRMNSAYHVPNPGLRKLRPTSSYLVLRKRD